MSKSLAKTEDIENLRSQKGVERFKSEVDSFTTGSHTNRGSFAEGGFLDRQRTMTMTSSTNMSNKNKQV